MIELTIVMPCLNESRTLGTCINKAKTFFETHGIEGEIVIGDNGSTDGSQEMARSMGARVIDAPEKGYGNALKAGIGAARGTYVIMGDSDDSYDFLNLMPYVEQLRKGYDLVMGNRFKGGIKENAMPFLHRYLGNPVLSFIGRLFFSIPTGDFFCGLRGFRKDSVDKLDLRTPGMEFAFEMVVKMALFKMKITEVPTTLSPDGRDRAPHLNTWSDGWRGLRFFLLYSPKWLFLFPGIFLFLVGITLSGMLISGPVQIGQVRFDVHTLLYASSFVLVGFQCMVFYTYSKIYAYSEGLYPPEKEIAGLIRWLTLEKGLIAAFFLLAGGFGLAVYTVVIWNKAGYGNLDPDFMLRRVIPATLLLILGFQVLFYSFFISVLQIKNKV